MLIGLTGTKSSGKGMFADILVDKGFAYFSLSDVVRGEAVLKGIPNYTIKQLQDIGDNLRKIHGTGALAKIALKEVKKEKNYVFDGIRNPGEIEEFRNYGKFVLIAVDAPQKIRYQRLLERKRSSDPKTWEDFLEMDKRDRGIHGNINGQQVNECMKLADIKIYNDGSVEEAIEKINKILEEFKCY